MTAWQKKYRWARTWGDETGIDGKKHEDYQAWDEEQPAGRIFLETAGPTKGLWRWAGSYPKGMKGRPITPNAGYAKSAAEAARLVEEYWHASKARVSH